jgi:hypothetical protein
LRVRRERERERKIKMSWHLTYLWAWFFIGMFLFMLKRAYWGLLPGPSGQMGTSYSNYFARCWVPLLIRAFWDSLIFWACFTPQLLSAGLAFLGWGSMSGVVGVITKFAVCAAAFGYMADSILDTIAATIGKKIPFLNTILPPLPPPLPQPAVIEASIRETKVTTLETHTMNVAPEVKG